MAMVLSNLAALTADGHEMLYGAAENGLELSWMACQRLRECSLELPMWAKFVVERFKPNAEQLIARERFSFRIRL